MSAIASLAADLWRARREGALLDWPGLAGEAEAYAAQEAVIDAAPSRLVGWKVGASAAGAPERLGLSGPFGGPIFEGFLVNAAPGETPEIALPSVQGLFAEVEVAFRIGPQAPEPDAVALALEFPAGRWRRAPDPAGPGYVADHGGGGGAAVGQWTRAHEAPALAGLSARLLFGGDVAAEGAGAAVMGDPWLALRWLAAHLEARGRPLRPGMVVLSGAMIGMTPAPKCVEISGEAPPLATVAARLRAT